MEGSTEQIPEPPTPPGGGTVAGPSPQYGQQPQAYPGPYPTRPYYPPPRKKREPEKKWMWIGIVGIIIVIIGGIMATIGQTLPPPSPWNYYNKSGNFDQRGYNQDYNAWVNTTRITIFSGKLLTAIGDALIGIMAIGIMMDSKIPEEKKKNLLLLAVVLFGLVLIATMAFAEVTFYPNFQGTHYP